MKPFQNNKKSIGDPVVCVIMFLLIMGLVLLVAKLKYNYQWQIVYGYLFFLGWFSWTFLEYMFHRFVWHSKSSNSNSNKVNKSNSQNDTFNHLFHQQHPTEIRMTNLTDNLLVSGSILLVFISIWIHNYFTVVVGFVCGFTIYTFTHLLKQKSLTRKIFAKKVRFTIHHHCYYPNKCFGISITWWDYLFGTFSPKKVVISTKVIDLNFREKIHKQSNVLNKKLSFLLMLLFSHFYSPAQERILQYDVTRNGNVIGFLNVTQKIKGNLIFLELKSEVKTRELLFSYSSKVTEDVVFEDGVMIYSFYYKKENGKETSVEAKKTDGYFNIIDNGNVSLAHYKSVRNNTLQLYCNSPGLDTESFSNHFQQFLDLKKVAENRYRLTLPNGNCNYYHYKDGICDQVDIERTFFTIHFLLRKN